MNFIATGIGAGLVSALLTMVVVKATPLAFMLYFLAPIPVLIVALGWNHRSGLIASLIGGITIAIVLSPLSGLAFALATGIPAWWLSYLALLGRTEPDGITEWYPLGRLMTWVALTAAISFVAVISLAVSGDFDAFHQLSLKETSQTVGMIETWRVQNGMEPSAESDLQRQSVRMAKLLPFAFSSLYTILLTIYLYLAGRVVLMSGRLARPWPNVASFRMPLTVGILGFAAFAGTQIFTPDTLIGVLTYSVAGALFMAFALQGLAAIHDRTQGRPSRGFLLAGLYVLLFLTQGIMIFALFLFGLADTAFGLRRRISGDRPKQPPTPSI